VPGGEASSEYHWDLPGDELQGREGTGAEVRIMESKKKKRRLGVDGWNPRPSQGSSGWATRVSRQ